MLLKGSPGGCITRLSVKRGRSLYSITYVFNNRYYFRVIGCYEISIHINISCKYISIYTIKIILINAVNCFYSSPMSTGLIGANPALTPLTLNLAHYMWSFEPRHFLFMAPHTPGSLISFYETPNPSLGLKWGVTLLGRTYIAACSTYNMACLKKHKWQWW